LCCEQIRLAILHWPIQHLIPLPSTSKADQSSKGKETTGVDQQPPVVEVANHNTRPRRRNAAIIWGIVTKGQWTINIELYSYFMFFKNILSFIYFKWYPPECKELIFGLYGSTKWEHVAQCDVIFPGFVVEIMWDKCKFWKPVSTTKCDQPDLRSWKSFRFMPRWYENIIGTVVSSSLFVCSCGSINEFIVLVQSKHHLCSANILFDN
jgi:hypothetical protein